MFLRLGILDVALGETAAIDAGIASAILHHCLTAFRAGVISLFLLGLSVAMRALFCVWIDDLPSDNLLVNFYHA